MGYSYFPEHINWANKKALIFQKDRWAAILLVLFLSLTNIKIIHINRKDILENFSEEPLDLILYEIDANEIRTGLSLIRKIRLRYPHTPIIAHTSCYITPHDVEKCYEAGCNELISKPFNTEELANTLMKYMGE